MAYNSTPYLNGLGISLKPPAWLRSAVSEIFQGTKVAVPSVTIPLPGGGSITTPSTKPTLQQQANLVAANIPGGWLTVAAVGAAALLILPKMMSRRR